MKICVVKTAAMVMLLRDSRPYGRPIICMTVCLLLSIFPPLLTDNLLVRIQYDSSVAILNYKQSELFVRKHLGVTVTMR
jgi:hypothetical protein